MTSAPVQILWFKRDLRLADHAALVHAAAAGPVAPVFIIEPDYWKLPDTSARQYAFLRECLVELSESCAAAGIPLRILVGDAIEMLDRVRAETGAAQLWSHQETGNAWTFDRDKRVAAWARSAGVSWKELPQSAVIRGLRKRTRWSAHWARRMRTALQDIPAVTAPKGWTGGGEVPEPEAIGLAPDPCPERQPGGRAHGLRALARFLNETGEPYRKAMSSPLAGAEHCSRLSPYLAWGCLSLREAAQAGWRRQAGIAAEGLGGGWPGSMRSFMSRLAWRDHFIQKLESEPELEFRAMNARLDDLRSGETDAGLLAAWQRGETGFPFVDACLRALDRTGWMNFRMRAMLAAFASYQLWQPWQVSGLHLARQFTDFEPGIHWPQMQMQSGVTGINAVRIYNPVKQGHDQDPDGAFMRHWLPELADVPDRFLHEPWKWEEAGRLLGKAYPEPVIELATATREARDRIFQARRQSEVRARTADILERHASRRPARRRSARNTRAPSPQMRLDL